MKAVEINNLNFSYSKNKPILKEINFELNYGEIVLLAGGSGQGKSTLFYLMNGIIPNSISGNISGEILIDCENINGKTIGEISRKIGSVLQNADAQIINSLVKEEIAFGCENIAMPPSEIKTRIENSCASIGISPTAKTKTLSGGEKQKLITATTIALDTKIIILDEPLANLDNISAKHLMETLKSMKNQGYAIVIIEHRIDLICNYVDKVYDMNKGELTLIEYIKSYLSENTNIIEDICKDKVKTNTPILTCNNLGFKISNEQILSNINFDIKKGERLLILGENGCGKTTLTKLLAKLLSTTQGEIIQNIDENFKRKPNKSWFKKVAYIYQNPNYQLFMPTVEQELLYTAHSTEYAQKICDMFELEPLLDYHPLTLSEGQKRKLSIAVMLAIKPEVIILDEPTVGQDFNSLRLMINNLNTIHQEQNTTIITITHDKRCALALCDRAILVKDSTIVENGDKTLVERYFKLEKR